jgi:hypothetical protein
MLWSRRTALRSLLATPLILAAGGAARIAGAQDEPRRLARYELINQQSTASPAESFHSFGMAFVQGDVPLGSSPVLLAPDGSPVPLQLDMQASWPDGSLRWADIACRAGTIPAHGTLPLDIAVVPGAAPAAVPLDWTNIAERSDLRLELANLAAADGVRQGSGQWAFSANRALANASRRELTRSGAICSEWRVWDQLRDVASGAPHPHLIGIAYLRVWLGADGTPGPLTFCLGLAQGWIGIADPTRLTYDAVLRDGDREIRRFMRKLPVTSVAPDGTLSVPGHGLATADSVMLEALGSPDDTVPQSLFYVHRIDDDRLSVHDSGYDAQNNDRRRALPDIGQNPALVRRIVHHHHSAWLALGADARLDWLGERPDLHGRHDTDYLRRTGMLPPYDLAQPVDRARDRGRRGYDPAPDYRPFGLASARSYTDSPGEHPQIGLLPGWCAAAFLAQDPWQAERARINAVAAAGYPNRFLDERTIDRGKVPRIPTVLDRDFAGLGGSRSNTYYYSSAGASPDMARPTGGDGPWIPGDTSHYPSPIYYPLLTEGGRHLMDLEIVWASYALLNRDSAARRRTVDRTYYGVVMRNDYNIRADGWAMRELSYAAAIIPDGDPERAYFKAALAENLDFALATIEAAPASFRAGGHWSFRPETVESPWMQGFVMQGISMVAKQHPDLAAARRFIDHHQVQIRAFADPDPLLGTSYRFLFRKTTDGRGDYLLPGDFLYSIYGAQGTVGVRFGADGRTLEHTPSELWRIADGDRVRFTLYDENFLAANRLPSGIADRIFLVVGCDGNRFRIADPAGGEALRWAPEEADSSTVNAWWSPRDHPAPRDIIGDPQGRYQIMRATLACAAWAGAAGFAELHARMTDGDGTDLSGNPKYAYRP